LLMEEVLWWFIVERHCYAYTQLARKNHI
jgi:hypothetical protein